MKDGTDSGRRTPAGTTGDNTERTGLRPHGTHGLIHGATTNSILSAAYRVHGSLGPGLLERVYHTCLCHELGRLGIRYSSEKPMPVSYDGIDFELGYRVDLLVENKVIVEIKAVEEVLPIHKAQLLTYLRLSRIRVGLLINFGAARLRDGITRRVVGS
ncbi:MAG: GxxExxY protein [Vicinamibacterales bacterium]